jgi:hypothetical protein
MRSSFSIALLGSVLAFPAAWAATDFSGNTAPSGAHYSNNGGGEPTCVLNGDGFSITCSGTVVSGVGNTDATVVVSIAYSGTVTCTNKGGNTVDVKTQSTSVSILPNNVTTLKNGTMTIASVTFGGDPEAALEGGAACPNGNWTKDLQGAATVISFSYRCFFDGFDQPFISKSAP